ncbi:DUF4118 domain-containing protein [Phenylobacterium sp. LjRoot219]|uniref:sensor histidine kinase n=1 Tax=Phenylobacterium sp. LjRoot219 TaxID=3342283 RepID=UPI003ECECAA4
MNFDRFFAWSGPLRGLPLSVRYLLATAVVLAFFALRTATEGTLGHYPFLLFFPAVIGIALVLDRGTGVFAVLLSAALAWYFFIPPERSFALRSPSESAALVVYLLVGLFLAGVIEALRANAARLQTTKMELERSDALKQLLLLDVNHRVKNHLLSVTALLRLAKREVADPAAQQALDAAAGRIDVLGKVYNRLHLGERATVVSSREFLVSLVDDLRVSVVGVRPIALRSHVEEVELSSAQAVPLGLITNELVGNALKHAFPDDRPGEILVRFEHSGDCYQLSVTDNGVGSPQDPNAGGGTRLMRSLAQQLGGELRVSGPPGLHAALTFPLEPPNA